MLTLFYSPGAASLVVHWLLIELDAEHELKLLDTDKREHKSPAYLKLNPNGVIPTLLVDGEPVYEAAALVLYLADAYPMAGLAPPIDSLPRAHYYQWLLHLANTLQPAFRNWFYPGEASGEANAEATREAARERIESSWDRIDAHLAEKGPWLLGDKLSAADFHLTMLMRWSRNMPRPATQWPQLARVAERMRARPSFKRLYEIEQLSEWA
ncbi:MAG: glutathione S-transferase family protein [Arenimonas sp.]